MKVFTGALLVVAGLALCQGGNYDYGLAIQDSLLFYQVQRSGKLFGMRAQAAWRKDSALNDRGNNGEDLTGGYYDAGDFVKFGFPMAYTVTMLAWGAIEYKSGYHAAGSLTEIRNAIKWGTDYFLKAHVSTNELYGQVGQGQVDHDYWGRPEDMTMARPAYKIDTSKPGSDLAAETAAALAAASVVFRGVDDSYANHLLNMAKQLYNFADQYRGKYSDSISDAKNFYSSYDYQDELVWGAAWLFRATNDKSWLTKAENYWNQFGLQYRNNALGWDDKAMGATALLAKLTKSSTYTNRLQEHCNGMIYSTQRTPKGLLFLGEWGSLRSAANVAFTCLHASDIGINTDAYRQFAKQQIDYMLGDAGRSFVVGFGNNPPTHAHHRSASCPDAPAACDWNTFNGGQANYHILYGALVGGPDVNDNYNDVRNDAVHNEVACDYNAGFQGVLAALKSYGY